IIQYASDGTFVREWNSAAETTASNSKKFNAKSIRDCCNPKIRAKTHSGFIWEYSASNPQKEKVDISNGYTTIGIINDDDYSHYFIKNDGSQIVDCRSETEMSFWLSNDYLKVSLTPSSGNRSHLAVHKIINQVLNNGDY